MPKLPKIPPEVGPLLTLGWAIPVWLLAGIFAGRWADGRWGLYPWMTLLGALLGIAGATYAVVGVVRKLDRVA